MQPAAANRPLTITADDTTGALESAAAAADAGWDTTVVPHARYVPPRSGPDTAPAEQAPGRTACVVDLRSRHATADQAAARLSAVLAATVVRAHKIDSTLRGNWPAEIASATAAGRRVLMVPSYPAAGRICRDGVVSEHGVPVDRTHHVDDPRSPVLTSRPISLLADAHELASAAEVAAWLDGNGSCAVADAADDRQLRTVVELACARDDVLLVGTAAVVGAVATVTRAGGPLSAPLRSVQHHIAAPVLVLCGSLHPVSRVQIQALIEAGAVASMDWDHQPAAVVVVSSPADRRSSAAQVATELATTAGGMVRSLRPATVLLIGGDTAEAFIGTRQVHVTGSVDVGVAIGTIEVDGSILTLVAKPGAFGAANTLVNLMSDVLTERSRP